MQSISPFSKEVLKDYPEDDHELVKKKLLRAQKTYLNWKATPLPKRLEVISSLKQELLQNRELAAKLITEEMGKLYIEALAEIDKCTGLCDYYVENAKKFLAPVEIKTELKSTGHRYDPTGVLYAIMPWNFPFWQVFRALIPNLALGNTVVLKHASNVQGCATLMEEMVTKGYGNVGLLQTLYLKGSKATPLIREKEIQGVTLTGSGPAGKAVASVAGEMVKKVVLELGGNDPCILFSDCDQKNAFEQAFKGRLLNSGQSCIAPKRFFVHKDLKSQFIHFLKERASALTMGDPLDENTTLAPLSSFTARDELHSQVMKTIEEGSKLILGGEIPDRPGAFYPVTILEVTPDELAFCDELFGPVFSVIEFESDDEVLDLANNSDFGLGASLYTQDEKRIDRFTKELEAGSVFINHFVKSDARLAFGGIKESGIGRELSDIGLYEFANLKTYSRSV